MDSIVVRGAREHNLKNLNLEIPRNRLVVITGVSGSGKSSLAFDTLFAEGQRRYVESLSAYARQFLPADGEAGRRLDRRPVAGDLDRAEVGVEEPALDGRHGDRDPRLPAPALRLDRRAALPELRPGDPAADRAADGRPRAGAARGHAARCSTRPTCAARRASTRSSSREMAREGFLRARIDGEIVDLSRRRCRRSTSRRSTRSTSWSTAWWSSRGSRSGSPTRSRPRSRSAAGLVRAGAGGRARGDAVAELRLRRLRHRASSEITPRLFSFNSPYGACPTCSGLGTLMGVDPDKVVPDPERSIDAGALAPWPAGLEVVAAADGRARSPRRWASRSRRRGSKLPPQAREVILYGSGEQRARPSSSRARSRATTGRASTRA